MARKRVLDPSIWTDDGMAELTPRQQLLYIGLISCADDEGRQKASPVAIRLSLPTVYANVKDGEIDSDLTAVLRRMRQLVPYIADERRYLVFLNYPRWQRIDRPSASNLPEPPQGCESVRRTFVESSTNVRPELKELKESTELRRMTPEYAPDFLAFYAAYPKHENKKAAYEQWQRLAPDAEMVATIMAAVERQKGGRKWIDGFANAPDVWLRGAKWEDEPEPVRLQAKSQAELNRGGQQNPDGTPKWIG